MTYALLENKGLISEGVKIHGNGFVVTPAQYSELIQSDSNNKNVLQPYLGGDDVTTQISDEAARYVINFGVMSLHEASQFVSPFSIVDSLVRPYRDGLTGQIHEHRYWVFWDRREKFFAQVNKYPFVLVCSGTAKYLIIDRVSTNQVLSQKLKIFRFHGYSDFALLQSTIHECWTRFTSATRGDGIAYSNSDTFATFPRPIQMDSCAEIGEQYYQVRHQIKVVNKLSLTQVYNSLNDPQEDAASISELRRLQVQMDTSAAVAYGWQDLDLGHGFHETRQGIRFTISESARREVLDRLLALNHQRHAEEVAAAANQASTTFPKVGRKKKDAGKQMPGLFD
jgi:hypothetical protein